MKSKIEWTDATWPPVSGCDFEDPSCWNCYAARMAATRLKHTSRYEGLAEIRNSMPAWTGEIRLNSEVLLDPIGWRKPQRIFVCSMSDLFHEKVPTEYLVKVFATMARAYWHLFQVLTKRIERASRLLADRDFEGAVYLEWYRSTLGEPVNDATGWRWPLPNVCLGTSAGRQKELDIRYPLLMATPAATRFLSLEPLIGPIRLGRLLEAGPTKPDQIITGGESGSASRARPPHPNWFRWIRDDCAEHGVPFFFKQWGNWRLGAPGETPKGDNLIYITEKGKVAHGEFIDIETDFGDIATIVPMVFDDKKSCGRLLDGRIHDGIVGDNGPWSAGREEDSRSGLVTRRSKVLKETKSQARWLIGQ